LTQGRNAESETLKIISACRELEALLTSPEDWISKFAGSYNNSVALCLLLDLDIPKYLSEQEPTSIETLMSLSGASESLLSNGTRKTDVHDAILTVTRKCHGTMCAKSNI
jgi:hypothetical protein